MAAGYKFSIILACLLASSCKLEGLPSDATLEAYQAAINQQIQTTAAALENKQIRGLTRVQTEEGKKELNWLAGYQQGSLYWRAIGTFEQPWLELAIHPTQLTLWLDPPGKRRAYQINTTVADLTHHFETYPQLKTLTQQLAANFTVLQQPLALLDIKQLQAATVVTTDNGDELTFSKDGELLSAVNQGLGHCVVTQALIAQSQLPLPRRWRQHWFNDCGSQEILMQLDNRIQSIVGTPYTPLQATAVLSIEEALRRKDVQRLLAKFEDQLGQ